MVKTYYQDDCKIKEYGDKDKIYVLEIENNEENSLYSIYSDSWEKLYNRAKEEAKKGNICEIWELKWVFKM